jgi:hypothetical protein
MTTELFANAGIGFGARATLASDPGSSGTTLTLTTGHGARFPVVASPYVLRLQCEDELMLVTAHTASADTMTVTRGIESTTAVAHATALTPVVAVLTAAAARSSASAPVWAPSDHGLIAAMFDPAQNQNAVSGWTAGWLSAGRVPTDRPATVTNIVMRMQAAGATLSNCFAGLYSVSGTLIAKTADQSTPWQSTGIKTMALTAESGQSLDIDGGPGIYYYLAFLWNGTTMPHPWGWSPSDSNLFNDPMTSSTVGQFRFGIDTGSKTALPSSLSSMSTRGAVPWMALS